MTVTVSAAFSFFGDLDYLEKCLARVAPVVDEIVLLDGPFDYAVPLLRVLGLYYDAPPPQLQALIERYDIKYAYRSFRNEGEKRIELYRMCSGDVVFLVDADELLEEWSAETFQDFIESDYAVAPLRLHNMCRGGARFGTSDFKFILFKRDRISAEAHLNYTWLVGWQQDPPDQELMMKTPIGEMKHYTLRRSVTGNAIKYAFYISLWKTNNAPDTLDRIGALPMEQALAAAGSEEALRALFTRSMPEMLNIHTKEGALTRAAPEEESPEREIDAANRAPMENGGTVSLLPGLPRLVELTLPPHKREGSEIRFSFEFEPEREIVCRALLRLYDRTEWLEIDWQPETDPTPGAVRNGVFTLPAPASEVFAAALEFRVAVSDRAELAEISDFHLKQSLVIHGNCQSEALAECLLSNADFRKRYWWIPTPGRLVHMQSREELDAFYELMGDVDSFIVQQVSDSYRGDRRYSTAGMLEEIGPDRPVLLYPNMFFNGYNTGVYVVRTRDHQILDRPMPIHDANMIYTLLKCGMDLEAACDAYLDLVRNPDHPVGYNGAAHCQASIDELRRRVGELQTRFGDRPNVAILDYAAVMETEYNRYVTHFSDAHPVERMIEKVTARVAKELGLPKGDFVSTLAEKGALPVPASVRKAIGMPQTVPHGTYINNRAVTLEELVDTYLESYSGMTNETLYPYISRDTARFIITNHKTGTRTMENFIRRYCELTGQTPHIYKHDAEGVDFTARGLTLVFHSQQFDEILQVHPDLRYRAVHLYREARNVITSGAYYHTVTDEPWCRAPVFRDAPEAKWGVAQEGNFVKKNTQKPEFRSYQQVISDLPIREQLLFEIDKLPTTFDTIKSMARFMERFEPDGNVLNLKLNTISTPDGLHRIFDFLDLDPAQFDPCWHVVNWWKDNYQHSTPVEQSRLYKDSFDAECMDRLLEVHAAGVQSEAVRKALFS